MLRFRRYRVFLLFAAFAIFAFYKFGNQAHWDTSSQALKSHLNLGGKNAQERQQQDVLKGKDEGQKLKAHDDIADMQRQMEEANRNNGVKEVDVPKPKLQEPGKPKDVPSSKVPPPPVASITKPVQNAPAPAKATKPTPQSEKAKPGAAGEKSVNDGRVRVMPHPIPPGVPPGMAPVYEQGSGRFEPGQLPLDASPIEWIKPTEHFPVPSGSTIALPTGTPKAIPKVQATFEKESELARKGRIEKRDAVKEAFQHAWAGYKEKAWGKDELMPISGGSKDPFNGWGATLIDSLDTLWIMGLNDEFEDALKMVEKVNFKTSRRSDIPIFETTIRYLGGLLGAYDVSNGKHRILLDKAVELAEIMMGSFDTPNRMPDTFYQWKPTFSSQPHRASTRVVLAELGSLAMEFTRLAQITREPKYYDAVARITDALEEWQNHTRLPGMWPTYVDASGCKKIIYKSPNTQILGGSTMQKLDWKGNPIEDLPSLGELNAQRMAHSASKGPMPIAEPKLGKQGRITGWDENHPESKDKPTNKDELWEDIVRPDPLIVEARDPVKLKSKRQTESRKMNDLAKEIQHEDDRDNEVPATVPNVNIPPFRALKEETVPPAVISENESLPECVPNGLDSQSSWGNDEYTLGSMSDSTYEYLPKMWIMLGGLVGKYREMYEKAMDTAKANLIFRVMIPNEKREVLVSGTVHASTSATDETDISYHLAHGGSHLTCFVGGMFAMGAKLFDRKEDLDIAAKLTDGCVWAYEMTASGIMPETFTAVPCDDRKNCKWNETKWWDELDPNPQWRIDSYDSQMKVYEAQLKERDDLVSASKAAKLAAKTSAPVASGGTDAGAQARAPSLKSPSDLAKRQFTEEMGREIKADIDAKAAEAVVAAKTKADAERAESDRAYIQAAKEKAGLTETPTTTTSELEPEWQPPTLLTDDTPPPLYSPEKPPTHEEYAKTQIEEERIPPGIRHMGDRRYILRPEALESIFYLHRLTASPYWRTAGWNMVSAILKHTRTPLAHAAIDDVTKANPKPRDSMESFWLAETLKYAFLMFEDEDKWSLDEWVLNTEAHLFKRVNG